jgi:hypothetical protein
MFRPKEDNGAPVTLPSGIPIINGYHEQLSSCDKKASPQSAVNHLLLTKTLFHSIMTIISAGLNPDRLAISHCADRKGSNWVAGRIFLREGEPLPEKYPLLPDYYVN